MDDLDPIPLFPLNTVLFPGQLLPLHIFEPRYLAMIADCVANDQPFGVVLIRDGQEAGGPAEPYETGTTARIRKVDALENGRLNILCLGERRFRIGQLYTDKAYLTAQTLPYPWSLPGEELEELVPPLRTRLTGYLETLASFAGGKLELQNLPDEPLSLACISAIALRLGNMEKQQLLEARSTLRLMESCIELLDREILALRLTGAVPTPDAAPPNTWNLN